MLKAMGPQAMDIALGTLDGPDAIPVESRVDYVRAMAEPLGAEAERLGRAGRWDLAQRFARATQVAVRSRNITEVLKLTEDPDPQVRKALLPVALWRIRTQPFRGGDAEAIRSLLASSDADVKKEATAAVLRSNDAGHYLCGDNGDRERRYFQDYERRWQLDRRQQRPLLQY